MNECAGEKLLRYLDWGWGRITFWTTRSGEEELEEAHATDHRSSLDIEHLHRLLLREHLSTPLFHQRLSFLSVPAMTFTRSVTQLVRSSRLAGQTYGGNPVLKAFGHDRLAARHYAAVYQRTKPHVNIGVLSALVGGS